MVVVRVEFESEFEFEGFVRQTGEPFIQIGLAYCLRSVTVAITSRVTVTWRPGSSVLVFVFLFFFFYRLSRAWTFVDACFVFFTRFSNNALRLVQRVAFPAHPRLLLLFFCYVNGVLFSDPIEHAPFVDIFRVAV
jgi:hypothetical protein